MDQILQTLLSWQFTIFGLAIAAVMFVIRKIVEYVMETRSIQKKNSKLWNDLILPTLPVILGAVGGAILKAFPYPDGLTTKGSRIVFGLVAGLLSTLLYRVVKALMFQKIQGPHQYPNPECPPSDDHRLNQNDEALAEQVRQTINKQ